MKTALVILFMLMLPAMLFAADQETLAFLPNGAEYIADQFLITTNVATPALELGQMSAGAAYTGVPAIDNLCAQYNVISVEPFYKAPVKSPILREVVSRMYIMHIAPGNDVISTADAFQKCPNLEYSELYVVPQITYFPNDPNRTSQYHLSRTHAYEGWDIFRGDTTSYAIIGIVDTGVYYTHPDLSANIWVNPGEDINGDGVWDSSDINGQDDDGNGYVDDGVGWDLGVNDNNPSEEVPTHGTHVAGDASEVTDNGLRGAGIGFSARLMVVKGANRSGQLTAVYQGMTYASDNGAHVINCSWGSSQYQSQYQALMNAIWANGVVIVAAAGNDGVSTMFYPAGYDNVLSVVATDQTDHKASWSNYGSWVDVCAPGVGIYATWAQNSMSTLDGTSMASPITAGLAALIRAQNPDWTNDQIVSLILATSDNIDGINPGFSHQLGAGRINVYSALASGNSPNLGITAMSTTITNDDGDGILNPGETFNLVITLHNSWSDAHNVMATFRGNSNLVVTDSVRSFGDIGSDQNANNQSSPFSIIANRDVIPGRISFTLHITSDSAYSANRDTSIVVSLDQLGFPKQIPGNVESSPLIIDFDGDGNKEVVVGASNNKVYSFESNGTPTSGWPQSTTGNVISGPAVGDIDNDGNDEVVAVSKDGKIYAWESNGSLLPGFPVIKGGTFFSGPLLIDLDGNHHLDIVAGSYTDNRVYVIDYTGADRSGWPITGTARWYGSPSSADIDGDQVSEIVYAGFDSLVHVWNGNGTEVAGFPVRTNSTCWVSPAIGDIDGDGQPEIIVATYDGNISAFNNDGSPVPGFPRNISGIIKSSPSLADLDGDGKPEIIFGSNTQGIFAIDGNGANLPGFPVNPGGIISGSPVVGDITGDGQPDIIVGSSNNNLHGYDRNGQILRNFPIAGEAEGQITGSAAIGNLDNDGSMEIAIGIKAATGNNLMVLDYKEPASSLNLIWPVFGKDIWRSNNMANSITAIDNPVTTPTYFALSQNYPNPFNASTSISFSLKNAGNAQLSIFDLLGRQVKTLQSGFLSAGNHSIIWNGNDESGNIVSSGIYFYRLVSDGGAVVRQMLLLK